MTSKQAHNQPPRHFKDALLLFIVPIGIIALLIAFLYIPRLFANPVYDFIYCEGYSCDNRFTVNPSGAIAESNNPHSYEMSRLYYYDVERDAMRPLTIDEANRYRLDTSSKSPDGYVLKNTSNGGGFLFGGGYDNSWSLTKGLISKPVALNSNGESDEFIGWVLQ